MIPHLEILGLVLGLVGLCYLAGLGAGLWALFSMWRSAARGRRALAEWDSRNLNGGGR